MPAGEVRLALLHLKREEKIRKRQGRWFHICGVEETAPVPQQPCLPAPAGMEIIRRLCSFHADVVREVQSSKVAFSDVDPQVGAQVRGPVDWYQLSRGEVGVSRSSLPDSFSPRGGRRAVFCGPLHRVVRRKRGGAKEWVWLPVFLVHAKCVREQTEIRFQLDGEVDLNLAWIEEMFSQGDEDLLEDTLIRLGMLREDSPGQLRHIPIRHFGECWRALEEQVSEHSWVRHRELYSPAEAINLSGDQREGIHPEVLLFLEEQSPFSKGLVEDLRDIAKATDEEIASSALSVLLPNSDGRIQEPAPEPDLPTVVEFSTLNPIQGEAVAEAFHAPLTVIQGPPGTGKSTVVRSALLTLGVNGSTALFGSTNHKAVDAVVVKMNECVPIGSLVADLRNREGGSKRWTRHLLDHLDAGRAAEGLDLDAFRASLAQKEEAIRHVLDDTRRTLEAGDRMVELQERLAALEEEHAPWSECLSRLDLPFRADNCTSLIERAVSPSWFRRLPALLQLWLQLRVFRAAWPTSHRPSRREMRPLLAGKLDQIALARLESQIQAAPSLEERTDTLVELVERKTDEIEAALGQLPPTWADRVRGYGAAIATLRRESEGRGRGAVQRREKVEREHLLQVLPGVPLWTVTNLSVRGTVPLVPAAFDLAVVDEAGQCNPASVLPMLYRAKRALFVGDPQQLRPIGSLAQHKEDLLRRRHGFHGIEFSRFAFSGRSAYDLGHDALIERGGRAFLLREHYRCHPAIAEFFNEHYYDRNLIVRTTGRDGASAGQGITWTHVEGGSTTHAASRWHQPQVDAIVRELQRLASRGFVGSVGVVTPFREHAKRIRDQAFQAMGAAQMESWDFICETADGFQGGERDLILFGLVGGGDGSSATPPFYLRERNRFNVAVSRAKHHLHVFGDELWARDCGVPVLSDLLRAAQTCRDRPVDSVRTDLIGPVWEPWVADALRREGIEFRQQYPAQGYYLDFALFPSGGKKFNVEVDGETYHRDRNGNLRAEDVRRDLVLRADGWTVQRFWVYQLREDWDCCLNLIRQHLSPQ